MSAQLELFGDPGDPGDAAAREAIRTRLDATLFVEAGAGTGKTAALVERVVALVTAPNDPVPMRFVAAITFTEKAAAELRDRIRRELERHGATGALEELDAAAICTLHSFAQRILTEFPIEAGLPPRVEIRDEISSRVAFEDRWRGFVDVLLDDPALESAILVMLAAGVRLDHLRAVAEVLDDNWDLLDRIGPPPELPPMELDGWLDELDAVCAAAADCRDPDDLLCARLGELAEYGNRLRRAFDDSERIRLLREPKPSFRVNSGRKGNWPDVDAVRSAVARLGAARKELVDEVLDGAIKQVVAALARCTAAGVAARRAAGELEFHDLLVLARSLLRDPAHGERARARLRDRYRRILVDEFQDTDPIQVEIAALLGADDPAAGTRPWHEITVEPGRLFFVGDPKQSIYRFRRADIATFLTAATRFADGGPLHLTSNFRTVPRVLAFVNSVFDELIRPHPGSQPAYRALHPARPDTPDTRVLLLGAGAHDDKPDAATLREREAYDVAAVVQQAIAERWPVHDPRTGEPRDARLGDVCILLPARTSLPYLERALDDAAVAYRAETSSLVYGSREVRDLLAALRAVDDPTDSLALVTALRSSLFGCGDDDLFTYHVEHGGRWDVRVDPPAGLPAAHPVADAMRFLGALHGARVWSGPSELLERIVRDRHVIEVAALGGRFRDVARRVRFVVDQARAFADAEGGTLRDYLAWAELQGTEGARVVEAVLPETDDDAVRILTIHGAKGLEFPIVVCSGMTTAAVVAARRPQVLFPAEGGYAVRLHRDVQTASFELHQPIDEQMGFHEKLRLLYVACTRARDHLVVSAHRRARELDDLDPARRTHAELIWEAARRARWEAFAAAAPAPPPAAAPAREGAEDPDAWEAERAGAFAQGRRRAYVSATTLARRAEGERVGAETPAPGPGDPGLAKEPRDLELPPWNKGRYGTAIGRAVHAVLQTVDLATGAALAETCAAQAAAEGVLGQEETITALARAALESAVVRRAASREYWRETYVAVPLDGITLEGYVDLVFRDDDGLVVVDYKTDAVSGAELDARLAHYRVQAAAYAVATGLATGEHVVRCVLCLLDPAGAREVVVDGDDLTAGIAEVRRLAAAERDDPSALPPPTLVDA
jgi:ATP-dependent exoDNAse (exonuclease V) beta subunit